MIKHVISLVLFGFILMGLFACSDLEENFKEVYVIVVDGQLWYYVMPGDGEATLSRRTLDSQTTEFIYIYNAEDFDEFSYENFFSPLGNHFLYKERSTGKFYILYKSEMGDQIYQFWQDYNAWKQQQGS